MEADSSAHEAAITRLPANTRAFCEAKGRLNFVIKDINNAGRALHAGDPKAAAKYNLRVLYRRSGKSKAAVVTAPAAAK